MLDTRGAAQNWYFWTLLAFHSAVYSVMHADIAFDWIGVWYIVGQQRCQLWISVSVAVGTVFIEALPI